MKSFVKSLVFLGLILVLPACSASATNSDNHIAENKVVEATAVDTSLEYGLRPQKDDVELAAESLLSTAFSFDPAGVSPTVTQENGLSSLRYLKDPSDPSDFFVVDFYDGYDYPMTLYHFCHSGEDEQANIAEDKTFQFDIEMDEQARKFVENVYGVDCSQATATAYGYSNKVSVQLDVGDNDIFQVRFYYQDTEPVGVLYFTNAAYAKEAMDTNNAVLLYSE